MWNPFTVLTVYINMFVSGYNHFSVAVSVEENRFSCQLLKVTSVWGGKMKLFLASGMQSFIFTLKVMHCRFFDQYQFRSSRTPIPEVRKDCCHGHPQRCH